MVDKSGFDWSDNIQQYQQAYMDAWQAFYPKTNGSNSTAQAGGELGENPWIEAMNQWWQSASDESSEPVNAFYDKMVEQGKAFLEMTETFNAAFNQAQAGSQTSATQWQSLIEQATENFQQVFNHSAWQMPLSNFQNVLSSMSFMPGDTLHGLDLSSLDFVSDNVQGHLEKMFSTPGVGQNRETQEQHQKLARLLLDYQGALQEYTQAQSEIGVLSTRRFQERLMEIAQSDEQATLTSFKQVYDCWVDCCEEVYADYVMTDSYVAIHGKVVNTLIAVKQQGRAIVDEGLGMLNMPTRREVDTLHRRFHQIRRDEKARQKEMAELKTELVAKLDAQASQIEVLQQQVNKAGEAKAKAPARARTTKAPANKVTAKASATKVATKAPAAKTAKALTSKKRAAPKPRTSKT